MKAKYGVQKGMKRVFGCASEKINGFILWKKKKCILVPFLVALGL